MTARLPPHQMRSLPFRTTYSTGEIPSLIRDFRRLVGEENLLYANRSLSSRLQQNPLLDDYIHSEHLIEFGLTRLLQRTEAELSEDATAFSSEELRGLAFATSSLQVFGLLSEQGRKVLVGKLRGDLKNKSLRSLDFELSTIVHLGGKGFGISFSDIETSGGHDFIASFGTLDFEVECKLISGDIGRKVHHRDALALFNMVRPILFKHIGSSAKSILVGIELSDRLSPGIEVLRSISDHVSTALDMGETKHKVPIGSILTHRFDMDGTPFFPRDGLIDIDDASSYVKGRFGWKSPQMFCLWTEDLSCAAVIAIACEQPDKIVSSIIKTLIEASQSQFSKNRPAVFYAGLQAISSLALRDLAHKSDSDPKIPNPLDVISFKVFERRPFIHSIHYVSHHEEVVLNEDTSDDAPGHIIAPGIRYSTRHLSHPLSFFQI